MRAGLRRAVQELAAGRCDYCRLPMEFDPSPFQIDHIVAIQHGGETVLENLALSCVHCNKRKGPNIAGIDPQTGQVAALFHPRRQRWDRHFEWRGAELVGRTRIGRATIRVLDINHVQLVAWREELRKEDLF